MNYLAKNIRLLRKNSSKRQEDIGFLVHKGQTTIGNWENGKSEPNIEELMVISNFFDISVDILLKVDLARTNFLSANLKKEENLPPSQENTVKYNHNDWESLVKEYDDRILSHILQEVQSLRQEFNQSRADRKADRKYDLKTERKASRKTGPKKNLPGSGHRNPGMGSGFPGPEHEPGSRSKRKPDRTG